MQKFNNINAHNYSHNLFPQNSFNGVNFTEQGKIELDGSEIDLNEPSNLGILKPLLSKEQYDAILPLFRLKEVDGQLVFDDIFNPENISPLLQNQGPQSTTLGRDELNTELSEWFITEGMKDPYNSNTTPALFERLSNTDNFQELQSKMNDTFQTGFSDLSSDNELRISPAESDKMAKYLVAWQKDHTSVNMLEIIFLVFRESIKDTNEDKRYFLKKLQDFNIMADQLYNHLMTITEHSKELGRISAESDDPNMVLTADTVELHTFDLSSLDVNGNLKSTSVSHKRLDREGLSSALKELESVQESIGNKRHMTSTAFQNKDQRSNQYYNMMASVMKSFNEMRLAPIRNTL